MKSLIELVPSTVKLTNPEINLLAKLSNDYGVTGDESETATQNRFTGETVKTNPLFVALVGFVYGCNTGFGPVTYRGKKVPVSIFDRARYLAMKIDGSAYSAILD